MTLTRMVRNAGCMGSAREQRATESLTEPDADFAEAIVTYMGGDTEHGSGRRRPGDREGVPSALISRRKPKRGHWPCRASNTNLR